MRGPRPAGEAGEVGGAGEGAGGPPPTGTQASLDQVLRDAAEARAARHGDGA